MSLFRTVALQRWVYDPKHGIDVKTHMKVPWLFFRIVGNLVKKQSYAQGVGRHSEEEMLQVMDEDLQALSKFLGITIYTLLLRGCGGGGVIQMFIFSYMYFIKKEISTKVLD